LEYSCLSMTSNWYDDDDDCSVRLLSSILISNYLCKMSWLTPWLFSSYIFLYLTNDVTIFQFFFLLILISLYYYFSRRDGYYTNYRYVFLRIFTYKHRTFQIYLRRKTISSCVFFHFDYRILVVRLMPMIEKLIIWYCIAIV